MAQTLTLARPARNLRPYLWLALPLLVLATLFFYPLLLRRTGITRRQRQPEPRDLLAGDRL